MSAYRVLLVDDQELMRNGTALLLGAHPGLTVVGSVGSGRMAIEAATSLEPDVVVMDVRMPGIDGIEATREICKRLPLTRVLILTTFDLDEYVFRGLRAGASAFLLKESGADELTQAVITVAEGDAILAPRAARRLIEESRRSLPVGSESWDPYAALTAREVDVVQLVVSGLSNIEIGKELYVSQATVKTHIGSILRKLGLRDRVQIVIHAFENGAATPASAATTRSIAEKR